MRQLTDFAALIFDMDGLVLDTETTFFAAWQRAIDEMGFQLDFEAFKKLSGYHYTQLEAQLLTWYGARFNLQRFHELSGKFWRSYIKEQGIAIMPGVVALLDYAQVNAISVCLATNSAAKTAFECLEIAGIEHRFPVIITGDVVQQVKPAPDIFLKAAERLKVNIKDCLVFEDSYPGIVAAVAAGAYSIYVPSNFPADPLASGLCDAMMDNLNQMLESFPSFKGGKL